MIITRTTTVTIPRDSVSRILIEINTGSVDVDMSEEIVEVLDE